MQNCLEVIADAVLQVVLFQVEADENESYLLNPDATQLVDGVCLLVDLAKKKAALWSETTKQQNQERMMELCREIRASTDKIAEYLQLLRTEAYDQVIKEELLFAAKNCMVYTVHLMELADQYDVHHIEKASNTVKFEQKKLLATTPRNFKENIENFIIATTNLSQEIVGRANYIVDPIMQDKLFTINNHLQEDPENLIKLTAYLMQQPTDGMAKDQQEEISYSIIATVDEITELAIQSSKELFEGILVDLDPIDRDKLVNRFLPTDPTCQSMIEALQKILEEMALNSNAAKKNPTLMPKLVRNAKDLNSALISLKDLVAKEIESEESEQRRKELQGVLDLLDAIMRDDILQSLKAAMENPNDDSLDSLLQAIAKMANALDRLKRLLNGEEDFDLLNGSVSKLQNALRSLQAALTKGDQEGMLSATKEAVARMKSQKGTIEDVSPSLMKLVEGTKAAMANPSDISAGDRLRKALEECRGSTHNLSPSSILPRSQLVTAMQILNEAGDLLVSNPKDSDKGLLGKELNQKGLDSLSHIIEQYTKNHPKHKGLLEKGNHLLTKSNSQLLMAVNESNISLAKKEQSNQRDAMIDLLNTALLAESDEAEMNALIDSATFLNHMLSKLNEATKLGDEFGATDAAKTAENTLSKEGLLIEMIAKKRIGITNPGAEARLMLLADDLQLERQELPEITIATLQDVTQHPRVSSCIAKVRNLNKEILGQLMTDKQIGDKMADINIDIELDADNIENILSTPVSQQMPDIQEPLSRICEEIGQQQLLSQSLLHNLPKDATATRRDTLQKALIGVDGTVNKLRTAAADAMKPAADRIAKNRLKKALNDVAIKSEELTAASQSSLIDRILNNGSKFNTLCGTISNSNDESNAFKAVKDGKALKRIQKQIVLCNQMANQCNDPQLKLVTRKLLEFARTSVQQVENIIPQATVSTQAAPLFDRLRQVNEKLMIAAQRAENCSLKTDINSLGDAANHMEQASKFLEIDDSPKGRLNALAKKIAEEMKKMADGAERKDKRAIITSAKTISQLTNNVVKIAAEIPSSDKFKQFKNEMLSMAHAARNYSVQLKILSAVKTASPDNDPTADSQLISCAKGLAHSVIETINGAEVLELKNLH